MPAMPQNYLGYALYVGRTLKQLTLREVALGAGVPTARLIAYERGIATPGPSEFLRVWSYLSTDPPSKPADSEQTQ